MVYRLGVGRVRMRQREHLAKTKEEFADEREMNNTQGQIYLRVIGGEAEEAETEAG